MHAFHCHKSQFFRSAYLKAEYRRTFGYTLCKGQGTRVNVRSPGRVAYIYEWIQSATNHTRHPPLTKSVLSVHGCRLRRWQRLGQGGSSGLGQARRRVAIARARPRSACMHERTARPKPGLGSASCSRATRGRRCRCWSLHSSHAHYAVPRACPEVWCPGRRRGQPHYMAAIYLRTNSATQGSSATASSSISNHDL